MLQCSTRCSLPARGVGHKLAHSSDTAWCAQLDTRQRGNYHLLESKLTDCILKAAGIDKKSDEARAAYGWKSKIKSVKAGEFAEVLKDVSGNRLAYCTFLVFIFAARVIRKLFVTDWFSSVCPAAKPRSAEDHH